MKRVLIFSLAYYPSHISGAEIAIKEITDRISREDIAFDVITLRFEKNSPLVEKIDNVRVYRVVGGPSYISKIFFPLLAAVGAYRLHRKFHYDAWWAMMSYMLFPIVLLRAVGVKLPYALTLQEGDTFEYMFNRLHVRLLRPLLRVGFRKASVIQAISVFLAGWPAQFGQHMPVAVIPNGASVQSNEQYPQEELDELKKQTNKKEGDIFLVTVSRLVRKNAVDDIVRALPHLPTNIKLLVVGGGSDEEMLKKLVEDLKLKERVVFTGQVDRTQTAKYRAISDIFARPSRSEGMGNSFASAMASRLPIIATQEGGLADFIFDAKRNPEKETTAWVVDKDSPEQIAEAVKDILASPEQVKKVTETCYKLVTEVYNWNTIAKTMQDKVFSRVLK